MTSDAIQGKQGIHTNLVGIVGNKICSQNRPLDCDIMSKMDKMSKNTGKGENLDKIVELIVEYQVIPKTSWDVTKCRTQ